MLSRFAKHQKSKEDINQQLYNAIYKKVTKKTHNNESPKKGDGTIAKCIELFNKGAAPNVLIELEKSLRKQEKYYNYYTEKFLPELEKEVMGSEVGLPVFKNEIEQSQGSPTRRGKILGIISRITNKSSDKNHSSSVIQNQKDRQGNAMELFNKQSLSGEVEIPKNSGINPLEKDSLAKGVSGKGTPGIYNPLRSSGCYGVLTTPTSEQLQARGPVEVPSGANTSKLSSSSDLDSGINSSSLASSSRRNSLTSVTSISSEESVHLKLNPAEEDNSLQLEDEGKTKLAHPNKTRPKGPSGRISPSKHYKKTEEGPHCVISVTGSKVKDTMQSNNYKNSSKNKNLHVALVTSSALLAIGCIVAGAMTSGLVGAGLFVVAAVFATAAAAEFCSNILSSKLTSISVSPLVDNKELTR
ncbi:DUF350 domain-containing protein [Wolbachia endosymbiont of Spodoptera picta]|uniref:DUF350 domain-containing protein n=1 Tax=Wolbachia endosymbiont of Spodoptera picta TaxID=2769078 RepID=UPI001BAA53F5|nr:DUF350 domain-containing protein [Wolbachia endosymbiont of Spodoptera picta]QUI60823.1 DUF350 domain-containing protein [Wolbachia endosymbiont of Spodoptera picta]